MLAPLWKPPTDSPEISVPAMIWHESADLMAPFSQVLTLQRIAITVKLPNMHLAADPIFRCRWTDGEDRGSYCGLRRVQLRIAVPARQTGLRTSGRSSR